MVKLTMPKTVTLPNGRTFVTRYKRIKRSELPPNIVMRNTHRDRATVGRRRVRCQQAHRNFDLVTKVTKNPGLQNQGLEYAPGIYHHLSKRVKNKTLKTILNSDAAYLALN